MSEFQPASNRTNYEVVRLRTNIWDLSACDFIAAFPIDRDRFYAHAVGALTEFKLLKAERIGVGGGQLQGMDADLAAFRSGTLELPGEVAAAARIHSAVGFWLVRAEADPVSKARIRNLRQGMIDSYPVFGLNSRNFGSVEGATAAMSEILDRTDPRVAHCRVLRGRDVFPAEPDFSTLDLFPDSERQRQLTRRYLSKTSTGLDEGNAAHSLMHAPATSVTPPVDRQTVEAAERLSRSIVRQDRALALTEFATAVLGVGTIIQLCRVVPFIGGVDFDAANAVLLGIGVVGSSGCSVISAFIRRNIEQLRDAHSMLARGVTR